jgi:hypothetical protein
MVRPLPGGRPPAPPREGRRPRRRAAVRLAPPLEAPRTAPVVAPQGRPMAQPRPVVPRDHQLHGLGSRPAARRLEGLRQTGRDARGALVGPRLAPRREGDHRKEHIVGTLDPGAADLRRAGRRRRRAVRRARRAAGPLSDPRRTRRPAADRGSGRPQPRPPAHNLGNHAVRTKDWRYIRYADGSEELYDHRNDPNEWTNLAKLPAHAETIRELARWLPSRNAPAVPGSALRFLSQENGVWMWEGKPIVPEELER